MPRSISPRCRRRPRSSACRRSRRAPTGPRTRTSASNALADLIPFIQVDLPGAGWLPDGRYLIRSGDEAAETVLVSELIGSPPARGRLRGRRPEPQSPGGSAPPLPVRRVTYALPERIGDELTAKSWLTHATANPEGHVNDCLALIDRAIAAYRVAAGEPALHEPGSGDLLAIRIGYGTGDEIAASRWSEAIKLPPERRFTRRPGTEDIRPQQRMAAILAGRELADPWELHALRARADFDAGRRAEAVAELTAALTDFDSSPPDFAMNMRDEITERLAAARIALGGPEIDDGALADAVELFERLQNRRRRPPAD